MTNYQLYLKEEDLPMWKEFTKIAAREGKPLSEIIKELTTKYVQDHKEGNSTFPLEKWVKNPGFVGLPSFGEILTREHLDSLSEEDFNLLVEKATARTQEISAAIKRRDPTLLHATGPEQSRGYS